MDKKKFISTFLNTICNDKELSIIDEYCQSSILCHGPYGKHTGTPGIHDVFSEWFTCFNDLQFNTKEIIVADDAIVYRWDEKGTHTGPLMGLAPTGRQIKYDGWSVFRVSDDQIVDYYSSIDLFSIVSQASPDHDASQDIIPLTSWRQNVDFILTELKQIKPDASDDKAQFSNREIECLSLYLNGKTAKQIAEILVLSYRTVQSYLQNAMLKLGCLNKSQIFDEINKIGAMHLFYDFYRLLMQGETAKRALA